MSNTVDPIEAALEKLTKLEADAYEIKRWINQGCEFAGREPMFPDLPHPGGIAGPRTLRFDVDEFFNKPMATAVREVLTKRKEVGMTPPADISDIHAALVAGGFNFPSSDPEKQKQGLAVSLGKNTITFRKLPSGLFGLAEWYGATPKAQRRRTVILRGEHVGVDDVEVDVDEFDDGLGSNLDDIQGGDPYEDEAAESPISDNSAASGPTPYGADEDGREVEHDNMNP